jgi:multicomponent Na+:H+ antiporter subunit G
MIIETATNIISWVLLLGGGGFCVIGTLGLIRMPDVYTRIHAASIIDTLGVGMILLGLLIQPGSALTSLRIAVLIVLVFFMSPLATHAIAKSLHHRRIEPKLSEDRRDREGLE